MVVEGLVGYLISHPEWGWALVLTFGLEQLFAPWETQTKKLLLKVEKRIQELEQAQVAQMTVIRALARVEEDIDTQEVDDYLESNGVSPDDFINDDGPGRVKSDD